jgi:single-strand DNA-binding protein
MIQKRKENRQMNKVFLMGRLTRDAEVRYSQGESSTAVARFSLAVDRRFKRDGEEQTADFINCVSFGKAGEFMERFGKKGTKFIVEGRIKTGSYTDKNGNKVYTTDVVTENIEFAESKGNASNDEPKPQPSNGDGFMNLSDLSDEELPFN